MDSLQLANLFKAVVQHHIYSTPKVCTVYFINNLLNDKSWKRVETCTYHSVQKKKTLKKIMRQKFWWMHTFIIYKLWSYKKISRPEKSSNDTRRKIRYFFRCVWYSQSAADTSLAFHVTCWWMNSKVFTILNPKSFVGMFSDFII